VIFLDASPIIALMLGTSEADRSEILLGSIESGRRRAITTPNALEEAAFKLVFAKASETLGERNPWRIRDALKKDAKLRHACGETLERLTGYVRTLEKGGLTITEVHGEDFHKLPRMFRENGLLTADCLHLIVMDRLGLKEIGSLDSDFQQVKHVTVIP
jgi:predicted nucleic acid-binding protein